MTDTATNFSNLAYQSGQSFHLIPRSLAPMGQGLFFICDHASFAIDAQFADLGLDPLARQSHVAGDIGAARVTELLCQHFGALGILGTQSRLVVDLNRLPDGDGVMPEITCGVRVPGNYNLTPQDRQRRLDQYFHPYHREIERQLALVAVTPILIAIHSFTPLMNGFQRPWPVGILYKSRDPRIAAPLMAALGAKGHLVGDNQPYSGEELNYTLDRHALAHGRPHVSVEIRQDLIADEGGCVHWASELADALAVIWQIRGEDKQNRAGGAVF